MRTLTSSLTAGQKAYTIDPLPRITLSKAGESDIVLERDRIEHIPSHEEREDSQTLQVICNNSDGYFTALTLQGWAAVIEWGLVTSGGDEYSACAPLKVMSQSLSSGPGALLCYLTMAGIPNQLADDKASAKYFHHKSDTKTPKDLITEIASGQPVASELTEEQTTSDGYINLDGTQSDPLQAVGQRVSIPNRLVTKIAFRLKKTGSPAGTNVTFVIRQVAAPQAILASKTFPIASITTSPTWCEATLTAAVQIDEEITWAGSTPTGGVWIYCENTDGTATDYVSVSWCSYGVKANEWGLYVHAGAGADDLGHTDEDCAVRYKYTFAGIDCFNHCTAYVVVYDPFGTHTGGTHATIMTDSAATFVVDALIGLTIYNVTDGSYGTITDNDATTVTVAFLAGGTDNQWESADAYIIADSLLDTYTPIDAFKINKNDTRLGAINKALGYTGCVKRFEADGKLHVFVPTTTGATYDYEYSLENADHKFFSKSDREALVSPNRIVVSSYEDDTDQYTGLATSAASYASFPKSDFISRKLISNDQATAIATAMIGQAERAASRGSASVPINVGAEVWDYVKVTDSRQADSRTGNMGVIRRSYNPSANMWNMPFSFGKGIKKAIPGIAPSAFEQVIPEGTYDPNVVVRWGGLVEWYKGRIDRIWNGGRGEEEEVFGINDIFHFLEHVFPNVEKWLNYINKVEGAKDVDVSIATALLGYIRRLRDDPAPQLGGNLNCNSNQITGVDVLSAGAGAIYQTAGSVTHEWKTDGSLDMGDKKIASVLDPTANQEVATKKYVDDNVPSISNINSGAYGGNNADNRAIAHGLGETPRLVILAPVTGGGAGYVIAAVNINTFIPDQASVTTWTSTNFYVNTTAVFFNSNGVTYNWVAFA